MVLRFKHIEINNIGEVTVVNFIDERIVDNEDNEIIEKVGEDLLSLVDIGRRKILLDFTGVKYINVDFMVKLVYLSNKLAPMGKLVMCNILGAIYDNIFVARRFAKIFHIVKDLKEAMEVFDT